MTQNSSNFVVGVILRKCNLVVMTVQDLVVMIVHDSLCCYQDLLPLLLDFIYNEDDSSGG